MPVRPQPEEHRYEHGEDFTSTGPKVELDWLESQLEGKYELRKGEGRLGPGVDDCKEILVLNRAIRWMEQGLEYQADLRQGESFPEGLELAGECKSVATPGLKPVLEQLERPSPRVR